MALDILSLASSFIPGGSVVAPLVSSLFSNPQIGQPMKPIKQQPTSADLARKQELLRKKLELEKRKNALEALKMAKSSQLKPVSRSIDLSSEGQKKDNSSLIYIGLGGVALIGLIMYSGKKR